MLESYPTIHLYPQNRVTPLSPLHPRSFQQNHPKWPWTWGIIFSKFMINNWEFPHYPPMTYPHYPPLVQNNKGKTWIVGQLSRGQWGNSQFCLNMSQKTWKKFSKKHWKHSGFSLHLKTSSLIHSKACAPKQPLSKQIYSTPGRKVDSGVTRPFRTFEANQNQSKSNKHKTNTKNKNYKKQKKHTHTHTKQGQV